MFIECQRHKSKIQRPIIFCLERCERKCGSFHSLAPADLAQILTAFPGRGLGIQLELFELWPESRPARR